MYVLSFTCQTKLVTGAILKSYIRLEVVKSHLMTLSSSCPHTRYRSAVVASQDVCVVLIFSTKDPP